jgi:hypothetical protein
VRTADAGATGAHADADALRVLAEALVAVRQWTFLLGPGLIPRINALFLGYVTYRSRLVPRLIPAIGLVGAPLILASATGTTSAPGTTPRSEPRGPCRSPQAPSRLVRSLIP